MKFIMYFIVIAGVAVAALTAVKAFRFSRELRARATRLAEMRPGAPRSDLPAPIQAFAERGLAGAAPGRAIRLKQAAEMRLRMGGAWREIPARQTIGVARSGFAWVASMRVGPVPLVRVLDSFEDGAGLLEVRVFGAFRLSSQSGPEAALGEALRYLAELPWAPDAILVNREITWAETPEGITATLDTHGGPATVRFTLDEAGDIVGVFAGGRPATLDDGTQAKLDWHGTFSDYREIGGRRVPHRAEVGYDYPEGYEAYFRGRITGLKVIG